MIASNSGPFNPSGTATKHGERPGSSKVSSSSKGKAALIGTPSNLTSQNMGSNILSNN